jgi:hypothetical protein
MKGTVLPRIGFDVKRVAATTKKLKTAAFASTRNFLCSSMLVTFRW